MDDKSIGANIRSFRNKAGMSQGVLAKMAELTKSGLSKIEIGRSSPPVSTLARIAKALNVPLAQFFMESDLQPAFVITRKGLVNVVNPAYAILFTIGEIL